MESAERPTRLAPRTGPVGLRAAVPGLIALSAVAAFSAWRGRPLATVVALGFGLVLLQLSVVRPDVVEQVTRMLEWVGHRIGLLLSVVLLGVTWLVVVVPVSLLNRLVGIDLLAHTGPPGWRRVEVVDRPERQYRRETRSSGAIVRRLARASLVLLPLAAFAVAVEHKATTVPPPDVTPFGDRATGEEDVGEVAEDVWVRYRGLRVSETLFPGEPWGDDVLRIQEEAPRCQGTDAERAFERELDLATEHVNVTDGVRRTFTVARPEYTVWMFGGSTTYGVGQRDEHTIASSLVRAARAEGVRLDVVNLGCPGMINWQETDRFELMLEHEDPPDLAIFLDGVNDWGTGFSREEFGLLDPKVPFVGFTTKAEQDARLREISDDGYEVEHVAERQVRLVAAQYRAGVQRARRLAAEHEVALLHVWQPALFTMPATAPGNATAYHNTEVSPASALDQGRQYLEAAARSGVAPIDLTDAFDDATQPYFFDGCHTNEAGARVEAAALLPHVTEALLVGEPPPP